MNENGINLDMSASLHLSAPAIMNVVSAFTGISDRVKQWIRVPGGEAQPAGPPDVAHLFPTLPNCERDCSGCSARYPSTFKINEEDELYGKVAPWSQHVLVATGKSDWIFNPADAPGSVIQIISQNQELVTSGVRYNYQTEYAL